MQSLFGRPAQIGESQHFMSGDEPHRLWAEQKGETFVVMVASTPEELRSLLDSRRVTQLSGKDADFKNDVAQASQILTLAEAAIGEIVEQARASNAGEAQLDDSKLDEQMRVLVSPLARIMGKVSTSRKPTAIAQLFQEQNGPLAPDEAEQYGEKLRQKLIGLEPAIEAGLDGKGAKNIIKTLRGTDGKWTVDQGMIWAPFVHSQAKAIDALGKEAEDCDCILSLERGGSLVHDEIQSATADQNDSGNKIPKRVMTEEQINHAAELQYIGSGEAKTLHNGGSRAYKIQQKADLRAKIDEIMAPDPDQSVQIAIAETKVGGGSVKELITIVNTVIGTKKYPNLSFRILALEQTLHSKGAAEGTFQFRVRDADRIKVIFQQTDYILGEDVDFQLNRDSKHPIIVFKGTKATLTAYRITPQHETVSRDIIVDLVDGAYNGSLPGVL